MANVQDAKTNIQDQKRGTIYHFNKLEWIPVLVNRLWDPRNSNIYGVFKIFIKQVHGKVLVTVRKK